MMVVVGRDMTCVLRAPQATKSEGVDRVAEVVIVLTVVGLNLMQRLSKIPPDLAAPTPFLGISLTRRDNAYD